MWNEAQIEEESDSKTNRPGSITHGPAKHGIILLCAYRYRFYTDNKILNAHYEILQTMSTFITNIFILASEFLSLFEPPRMFYSCAFFFVVRWNVKCSFSHQWRTRSFAVLNANWRRLMPRIFRGYSLRFAIVMLSWASYQLVIIIWKTGWQALLLLLWFVVWRATSSQAASYLMNRRIVLFLPFGEHRLTWYSFVFNCRPTN